MPVLAIILLIASLLPLAPVQSTPLADAGCPSILTFGTTALCSLLSPGAVGSFTLSGAAGDRLLLRMGRSSGSIKPRIRVVTPSSTIACTVQDYGTLADLDTCVLSATGSYTIQADSWDGVGTGTYGLTVQRLNTPIDAVPLAYGQTVADALIAHSELDTYTFSATTGDALLVRMASTSSLKPRIRVFRSDGTALCAASSYSLLADLGACLIPATDTYTLVLASAVESATGTYSMALQRANTPATPTTLVFGQPLTATTGQPC